MEVAETEEGVGSGRQLNLTASGLNIDEGLPYFFEGSIGIEKVGGGVLDKEILLGVAKATVFSAHQGRLSQLHNHYY